MENFFETILMGFLVVAIIGLALLTIIFLIMAIDFCIDAFIEYFEDKKSEKAERKQQQFKN